MVRLRPCQPGELNWIIAQATQSAAEQLVARQRLNATPTNISTQLVRMFTNVLAMPDGALLVIDWPTGTAGDGVAGYVLLMKQQDVFTGAPEMVVMDIFTHPSLRGRHLAQAMLQQAETYGRSTGCLSMLAQVAVHNLPSLRSFARSGYQSERYLVGKSLGE
jgi:ribosomal protein S18 acetylase RimI-like enzyme